MLPPTPAQPPPNPGLLDLIYTRQSFDHLEDMGRGGGDAVEPPVVAFPQEREKRTPGIGRGLALVT
jgi:hypothetical protein